MDKIIEKYKRLQNVEAIALGGSSSAKTDDINSDMDIYIYVSKDIPIDKRDEIVKSCSSKYEVGGEYFGSGDEYWVDELYKQFDVMYWNISWFESVVDNIWMKHYPSNGYTTCFLYTLKNQIILYDKNGRLKALKDKINTPYPKELKQNIIKRNMMLLKDKHFASYYEQIEKAMKRKDIVSINHRIAAFLASYFDILFAVNEMLHPGEKRLIQYAKNNCNKLPENFEEDINDLITNPDLNILERLVENIKKII